MLDFLPTAILQSILLNWISYMDWLDYLVINISLKDKIWPICLEHYLWSQESRIPSDAKCIRTANPNLVNELRREIRWKKFRCTDPVVPFPCMHLPNLQFLELQGPLDKCFPPFLLTLKCGQFVTQPICIMFPLTLTSLYFDATFNVSIQVPFPDSLTILSFGYRYNEPFLHPLPTNLTTLHLGKTFNQVIPNLPSSLQSLLFHPDGDFNHELTHLPPFLHTLWLSRNYCYKIQQYPTSLTNLSVNDYLPDVPSLPLLNLLQIKTWHYHYAMLFPALKILVLYGDQDINEDLRLILPTTLKKVVKTSYPRILQDERKISISSLQNRRDEQSSMSYLYKHI